MVTTGPGKIITDVRLTEMVKNTEYNRLLWGRVAA